MKKIITSAFFYGFSVSLAVAQGIGNEEVIITKEREITLPKANRIYDKVQVVETEKASKTITYTFFDRKPTGVEATDFKPNIVNPAAQTKTENYQTDGYYSFLKLGGGNYGRTYGELSMNSYQNDKLVYGIYALHNSAKRGPIEGENSGNGTNIVQLNGKYHARNFELKGLVGYDRENYFFYGYDTTLYSNYFQKDDIRQILNKFNFGIGFENTNPDATLDYQLQSQLKTLKDNIAAQETDWGTNLALYIPLIKDKIIAKVTADAYITQRTDNDIQRIQKRNLFRVHPSFNFNYNQIGVSVGYRAVNQYDQINDINQTFGYPTAEVTYKTPGLFYFSLGYDGDVIRNTLGSLLEENRYLRNQVPLENTQKNGEIYLSSKGALINGLNYNAKVGYGTYTNLYYFTVYDGNQRFLSRKYDVVYDPLKTPFIHGNVELNYQPSEAIRSNINFNYYHYEAKSFEKPFHRPSIDLKFTNSFVIAERFVAAIDMYYQAGIWAKDPFRNEILKLPAITDINTEFDYLLSNQFTVFVRLNNILGKNYQRYLFYPQQGLNFLVGLNVSI